MTNSVFYCDEQDSLDYNGYKLYRLILEVLTALSVMNIMCIGLTNIRSWLVLVFRKELL